MSKRLAQTMVGFFMILGLIALTFLALKVSGLTTYSSKESYYKVYAEFDNVGGLKVRAPIMVSGVSVGQVGDIALNPSNFRARVTLLVQGSYKNLPDDTAASIYTQGLLGANYVNLSPGFSDKMLVDGSELQTTQPAIVLEKLIGQFMYSIGNKK